MRTEPPIVAGSLIRSQFIREFEAIDFLHLVADLPRTPRKRSVVGGRHRDGIRCAVIMLPCSLRIAGKAGWTFEDLDVVHDNRLYQLTAGHMELGTSKDAIIRSDRIPVFFSPQIIDILQSTAVRERSVSDAVNAIMNRKRFQSIAGTESTITDGTGIDFHFLYTCIIECETTNSYQLFRQMQRGNTKAALESIISDALNRIRQKDLLKVLAITECPLPDFRQILRESNVLQCRNEMKSLVFHLRNRVRHSVGGALISRGITAAQYRRLCFIHQNSIYRAVLFVAAVNHKARKADAAIERCFSDKADRIRNR